MNSGTSAFTVGASTDPTSLIVADMTGKGVVDLVGANGSNLEIWPNNGTPSFSSSPITLSQPISYFTIADMDGDGFPDIVSACVNAQCGQIFYGNGAYQFTPVTITNMSWPYIEGDFNGDGKLDIATGSGIFLNTGNRTFQEVSTNLPFGYGVSAVVGDFNGDGKDDVAIAEGGSQTISIYYSNGDGSFIRRLSLTRPTAGRLHDWRF